MRRDRPRLRWGARVAVWVGLAGALVGAVVFDETVDPVAGLIAVPFGIALTLLAWYVGVWATPLRDPARRVARLLRLVGTTMSVVSAASIVLAELYAISEEPIPALVDGTALAGIVGFPLGLMLVFAGLGVDAWIAARAPRRAATGDEG